MQAYKRGFTLLEILLVITLLGILATIVLIAINPARQLAEARNAQRLNDITKINKALEDYSAANRAYPDGVAGWYKDICPSSGGINCVDLNVLKPDYLISIPIAPNASTGKTGYTVAVNTDNEQISLKAQNSELGVNIVINPLPPITTFAKQSGGADVAGGVSVSTSSDGSSIVTGYFQGTTVFGQGETNQTSLVSSPGEQDIFIAKYNANGTLAWAKQSGGTDVKSVSSVSALSDGSSIITGDFYSTVIFGQGDNQIGLASAGWNDIFIAKYNANGTLAWAKRAGGNNKDSGNGISVLSDGSSIITGHFYSTTAIFGQGDNQINLERSGSIWTVYIAKYNANGTLAWAKRAGGTGLDVSVSVSALSGGSSIITGYFQGTAVFGQGDNQISLESVGGTDIYIAKYNADGTLAWAKQAGGSASEGAFSVSASNDGSSIITGYFQGTAVFGQGDNQISLESVGGTDIYIAKYNADGTLAWAKQAGGSAWEYSFGAAVYTDGSSIITGRFSSESIVFSPEGTNLVSQGSGDIFIAKYDIGGNLIWAKNAGGPEFDTGSQVSTYKNGSAIITGYFSSIANFGIGDINQTPLSVPGTQFDMFIFKISPDGKLE